MFDIKADEEDEQRQIANLRETLSTGDGSGVSKIIEETASDLDTPLDGLPTTSKAAKRAAV